MLLPLIAFTALGLVLPGSGEDAGAKSSPQETIEIFRPGPQVTLPVLLQKDWNSSLITDCKQKFSGNTELALIVDQNGKAQNVRFVKPQGSDVDRMAVHVAEEEQFTPGTMAGAPVPVAVSLNIKIEGCLTLGENGKYSLNLRAAPEQRLKGWDGFPQKVRFAKHIALGDLTDKGACQACQKSKSPVKPPIPLVTPTAEFPHTKRRESINGECVITVIVDEHGLPQSPKIVRSLEPSFDEQALIAVNKYRFAPALKDGIEPVRVMITIAVNFH